MRISSFALRERFCRLQVSLPRAGCPCGNPRGRALQGGQGEAWPLGRLMSARTGREEPPSRREAEAEKPTGTNAQRDEQNPRSPRSDWAPWMKTVATGNPARTGSPRRTRRSLGQGEVQGQPERRSLAPLPPPFVQGIGTKRGGQTWQGHV